MGWLQWTNTRNGRAWAKKIEYVASAYAFMANDSYLKLNRIENKQQQNQQ